MRNNVLATLAYYDIFDFPLKAEEICLRLINFKHLHGYTPHFKPHTSIDIQKSLDQLILDKMIDLRDGYYFLFDREYIVPLRLKREKIAKYKWRIAKHAVHFLSLLPYMQAIFASGSLAMNNTNELSDLDILIVAKRGHIWLSRFLVLGMLALLGIRRKGTDLIAPGKICASHFITDRSLSISLRSIYNAQVYGNLIPIYATDQHIIEEFKNKNNWILDYSYSWNIKNKPILMRGLMRFFSKTAELILDTKIGDWLENLARDYQSKRILRNPITEKAGDRVIFNDERLMFRINSAIFKTRPVSLEEQTIKNYNQRLLKLKLTRYTV